VCSLSNLLIGIGGADLRVITSGVNTGLGTRLVCGLVQSTTEYVVYFLSRLVRMRSHRPVEACSFRGATLRTKSNAGLAQQRQLSLAHLGSTG
jgi:hypothetical protein